MVNRTLLSKKKFWAGTAAIVIAGVAILGFIVIPQLNNHRENQQPPNQPSPPPYTRIQLDNFPISLSVLFRNDTPIVQQAQLNDIALLQTEQDANFMDVYPDYTHAAHTPATFKWGLDVYRFTPISLPIDSYMVIDYIENASTTIINNTSCVDNVRLDLILTYYISIHLDHACVNQSLVTAAQNAPATNQNSSLFGLQVHALLIPKNTIFGFTRTTSGLDFAIIDESISTYPSTNMGNYEYLYWKNPYWYFTPAVQAELSSYYQAQYKAMSRSGLYVEGRLDRNFTINEGGTLFGAWFYESGWFTINASDHPNEYYSFAGSTVNILDVNQTDRAIFYKDKHNGTAFNSSMQGVYSDGVWSAQIPGYTEVGGNYLYRESGDNQTGIFCLQPFFTTTRTHPVYVKCSLIQHAGSTMWQDELKLEYYPTLNATLAGFNSSALVYSRVWTNNG
ncbi:MAG TPA: hypothetical protein VKM55_17630 [Candidatus Lokiarchaeia archaeon]|nr:hypothetical protein [Candidatus Lokiarchaeia archaeon]